MKRVYLWLLPAWVLLITAPDLQAQQIVAQYDFNGNARDVSTNQNHATIHGASLTQDRFGQANQAFVFNGTKSYLVANNTAQPQSPTITVSFWMRRPTGSWSIHAIRFCMRCMKSAVPRSPVS